MQQKDFLEQAMWVAKDRNYHRNWVYVIFKKRYGCWPSRELKPCEPVEATKAFLDWLDDYWKNIGK